MKNVLERQLAKISYDGLPEHMREGVQRYIELGVPPGRFLSAVICNDLKNSFALADDVNRTRLFDIVSFFYNQVPANCWSSIERMKAWQEHGGLLGWIEQERKIEEAEAKKKEEPEETLAKEKEKEETERKEWQKKMWAGER